MTERQDLRAHARRGRGVRAMPRGATYLGVIFAGGPRERSRRRSARETLRRRGARASVGRVRAQPARRRSRRSSTLRRARRRAAARRSRRRRDVAAVRAATGAEIWAVVAHVGRHSARGDATELCEAADAVVARRARRRARSAARASRFRGTRSARIAATRSASGRAIVLAGGLTAGERRRGDRSSRPTSSTSRPASSRARGQGSRTHARLRRRAVARRAANRECRSDD